MAERTTEPKPDKVAAVEELERQLRASPIVILTDYRGLTVDDIGALRARLREVNVEYRVAKNTLLAIAAERCGYTGLVPFLTGPSAVVFGRDDPSAPARVLQEFIRQYRKLEIKGGVVSGEALNADEVRVLASLPSRAELLARAVGLIQAPLRAVAVVLSAPARGLVTALDSFRAKREAATGEGRGKEAEAPAAAAATPEPAAAAQDEPPQAAAATSPEATPAESPEAAKAEATTAASPEGAESEATGTAPAKSPESPEREQNEVGGTSPWRKR